MRKESVLSRDLEGVRESQRLWLEEREKKINIYRQLEESIAVLESTQKNTTNPYSKWKLSLAIRRLRWKQKKYEVDSILSLKLNTWEEEENALEKSSYTLVKKLIERRKEKPNKSALEKSSYTLVKKYKDKYKRDEK